MPETPKPLTPQQARFVDEYLIDLNATQAAIRAGYAESGAKVQGCRLLTYDNVAAKIAERADERAKRVQVDADTVLRELLRMATVDPAEAFDENNCLLPIKQIPENVRRAIASVETEELYDWEGRGEDRKKVLIGYTKKVKFWDKKGSNDSLGKHLRLFVDRVEHTADESLAALITQARKS